MNKTDVLDLFGGNKMLAAKELKVARQSIYAWPDSGDIPTYAQMRVRDYLLKTRGVVPRKWMPR